MVDQQESSEVEFNDEEVPSVAPVEQDPANGIIEFEFTIEKVNLRFKGPVAQARIAQANVNRIIDAIAYTPNQSLKLTDGSPSPALPETSESSGPSTKARAQRKPRTASANSLGAKILSLRDKGFFSQKRTIAEVRDELSKGGHNVESKDVSASLLYQTQQKTLLREKNENKKWVYFAPN